MKNPRPRKRANPKLTRIFLKNQVQPKTDQTFSPSKKVLGATKSNLQEETIKNKKTFVYS